MLIEARTLHAMIFSAGHVTGCRSKSPGSAAMKLSPLAVCCALAAGCSQIEVKPWTEDLIEGIPYSLPQKAFSLAVEYELKDCFSVNRVIQVERKVTLASALVVDPAERYYVPYSSLRNWFKATDFTLELH